MEVWRWGAGGDRVRSHDGVWAVLDLPGDISGCSPDPLGFEGVAVVSVCEWALEYPDLDQILGHGFLAGFATQPWALF